MAILSGKEILKPFVRKTAGYIKSLLSSEHVEMKDGTTLQQTLDKVNSNLTKQGTDLLSKVDINKADTRFSALRCEASTKGAGGQTYGRTFCFDLGMGNADKYYLTIASNGGLYVGLQLNGASSITWYQK